MSAKSATDYIAHLIETSGLESGIEASVAGGDFFSAAAAKGFVFDSGEWTEALKAHSDNGAISDDELEGVDGGSALPPPVVNDGPRNPGMPHN